MKGVAKIPEPKSDFASVRYRGYLTAAVERWKEYRDQLKPLAQKPVLFIMMNSTEEADDVADWLAKAYPAEFGDGKTQIIHTENQVRLARKIWKRPERPLRVLTHPQSPIQCHRQRYDVA